MIFSVLHPQTASLRQKLANHARNHHCLLQRNLLAQSLRRFSQSHHGTKQCNGRKYSGRNSNPNNPLPPYVIYGFVLPTAGLTVASVYAYYSCLDFVPYTQRRRFLATSQAWEAQKGHQQYKALLQQHKNDILPENHRASVTVRRVGSRIAKSAEEFMKKYNVDTGSPKNQHLSDSPYTYTVIRSDEANAFVLPGNHVFVLTGLFRYCHNEDELASIIGHEMAHNIARHAGERISDSLVMTMLSRLTLLIDPSGVLFSIFVPAQTLLYSLPHSREHEVEADKIGLVLASEACYDPRSAKKVFSRMKDDMERGSGKSNAPPPEFISTHPGYDTRLSYFDEWMPDAMERFNEDGGMKCKNIRDEMTRARRLAAAKADLNQ